MKNIIEPRLMRYAILYSLIITTAVSVLLLTSAISMHATATKKEQPQHAKQDVSTELLKILEQDKELLIKDPQRVCALANEAVVPHFDFSRVSNLLLGKALDARQP